MILRDIGVLSVFGEELFGVLDGFTAGEVTALADVEAALDRGFELTEALGDDGVLAVLCVVAERVQHSA